MPVDLPADIADALAHAGLRAASAEVLTLTPDPAMPRALYRVRLDCGRAVKARRFESEGEAARQQALRAVLPSAFAAVVARSGAVLIEEWIDGRSLADGAPGEATVRGAARLLAAMHATPELDGRPLPLSSSTARWRALSEATLDELAASGALDCAGAAAVRAVLASDDPGAAESGVAHLDFCGENMVIDGEGRLRLIDNEWARVDAFGHDLARTRYRWALDDEAWAWFRDAYLAAGGSSDAVAHQRFWFAVALCVSALFRARSSHSGVSRPLDRLRQLALETHAGGGHR